MSRRRGAYNHHGEPLTANEIAAEIAEDTRDEGDTFPRTTKAIDDVIADTRAAIEQRAKRST